MKFKSTLQNLPLTKSLSRMDILFVMSSATFLFFGDSGGCFSFFERVIMAHLKIKQHHCNMHNNKKDHTMEVFLSLYVHTNIKLDSWQNKCLNLISLHF